MALLPWVENITKVCYLNTIQLITRFSKKRTSILEAEDMFLMAESYKQTMVNFMALRQPGGKTMMV